MISFFGNAPWILDCPEAVSLVSGSGALYTACVRAGSVIGGKWKPLCNA